MQTLFVIERRQTPQGQWQRWTHVVPLSSREDAERQAAHLASREPYPVRSWITRAEFRAVEAPLACPKCVAGGVGPLCDWHERMARLGATVAPPRSIEPRKPLAPSPRVRRSPRAGYGPAAIALLRAHSQGDDKPNAGGAE